MQSIYVNIMSFEINAKYIRKYKVIWNKTVTKIFIILTKCFFHIWTLQAALVEFELREIIFTNSFKFGQRKACTYFWCYERVQLHLIYRIITLKEEFVQRLLNIFRSYFHVWLVKIAESSEFNPKFSNRLVIWIFCNRVA